MTARWLRPASTWERPWGPPSGTVARVAAYWFGLSEEWERAAERAEPAGLLVGEQPAPASNQALPLWPHPPLSAGGRLRDMSGIEVGAYLLRLARVNLHRRPVARWSSKWAEHRAHQLLGTLPDGARVVLCGARARDAVPVLAGRAWFAPHVVQTTHGHAVVVAVPHPSGRCREYNDPAARDAAGAAVRWAAGLED